MRRYWPIAVLLFFFLVLFKDFFFKGFIPVPADTLVGAYYPWLDYKWGYAVGVPVKNPIISDVFSQFFIWKHLSTDILKQGLLPFWNPYSFSGTPFLATFHSTTLSPWNLFFLLPKYWGWGIYIFASFLFAGLSMYFYLSLLVRRPVARLVGAVIFALGGPMTTWAEFGTAVWAAGCLPLLFLSLEMIITHRRPKYYFLLIASAVLLVLSGHVQLLTYAFILVPVYALVRSRRSRVTLLAIFALVAAVVLTSVQLIPTADLYTRSIRAEEKYTQTFNFGLTPFPQFVRLWIADFFGNPTTGNTWGNFIYHEYSSFLGTLALPLVIAALFYRRKFSVSFFSVLFLGSLFLALDQPLSRWFFSLPLPLFTYSSASRFFFLISLSGAVLAAQFLDSPAWRRIIAPAILLLFLTAVALYFVPPADRLVAVKNSIIPVVQLGLLLTFIIFFRLRRFLPIFILGLLVFDLGRYFIKYNPFVPARIVFPDTPVTQFLQSQPGPFRIARQPAALLPPNTWAMYGIENIEGYDPLYLNSYSHLFHVVNAQPYTDSASRYSELTDFNPRFLDALNVKYIVTEIPEPQKPLTPFLTQVKNQNYPVVFSQGHVRIYQNPSALPRAYFASRISTVSTESELAQLLDQPNFDPTQTALIFSPLLPVPAAPGTVTHITEHPNKVLLTASATSSGLLVIANSYDPGWTATIDDQFTPVYRTNGGLQSIVFPGGTHQVIMSYQPPYFPLAFALTALAWVGVVCSFLWSTRYEEKSLLP